AILSVGTELLFGQTINTNAAYLSQQLNLMGFDVMYHYTVGDNPKRLEEIICAAFKDCDLVITTGGLGPTQDDLTKEVVSEVFNDVMITDEKTLEWLESYFIKHHRIMTENNKKQANMPSRAIIFDNDAGTAPGFALEEKKKIIICLPGPPREMTRMFQLKALPYLEKKTDEVIYYRMIRTFGIGESQLETDLLGFITNQKDPTLATYAKEGECSLRIASKRKTQEEAEAAVNEMIEKIMPVVGDYIYSLDDENLEDVVGNLLIGKNISISCAESCTGGMFAETVTSLPGISKVFDRGLITYSNKAKMEELGVKEATLEQFGAVSSEVAVEMTEGLKRVSNSRLCISVTGIAGPDGGTLEKPVGLVYICAIFDEKTVTKEIRMRNVNRRWNRNYSVLSMLNIIYKLLLDE
ncbi:MAG: competence/damage-inducible protein A, partial [Peptostreptococcaceae bacterium]|nr:competence/damage-inducible protein A [Peptostreptococcaceae bacterium]